MITTCRKLNIPIEKIKEIRTVIIGKHIVASYSSKGFLALSIIFPIQLLMTALATGTGVGINIMISKMDGEGETDKNVLKIGNIALRIIALSFLPAAYNLIYTVYFQGTDRGSDSLKVTILRQIMLDPRSLYYLPSGFEQLC